MSHERKLVLFLYVKGKEVKRILTVPDFDEALDVTIIQSINGLRETVYEGHIEPNSSSSMDAQVNDDEFEANLQGVIDDENEFKEEVKVQKEIENEFEEAVEAENEKGRQKKAKLQKEENERLADMKRKVEEDKIKKKTSVTEKKERK